MYLLQNRGGGWKVDSASCSTSSITRFATTTDTGDPIVYFAFKGQVGGLQAELEKGADVIHGEAGSVWKRRVIHQTVTGNLDGSGGWRTGEKRHNIERH